MKTRKGRNSRKEDIQKKEENLTPKRLSDDELELVTGGAKRDYTQRPYPTIDALSEKCDYELEYESICTMDQADLSGGVRKMTEIFREGGGQ